MDRWFGSAKSRCAYNVENFPFHFTDHFVFHLQYSYLYFIILNLTGNKLLKVYTQNLGK